MSWLLFFRRRLSGAPPVIGQRYALTASARPVIGMNFGIVRQPLTHGACLAASLTAGVARV